MVNRKRRVVNNKNANKSDGERKYVNCGQWRECPRGLKRTSNYNGGDGDRGSGGGGGGGGGGGWGR